MTQYTLTPEARAKLTRLQDMLLELGLDMDQAHALTMAESFVEQLNENDDPNTPIQEADFWANEYDATPFWADVVNCLPGFVTEA